MTRISSLFVATSMALLPLSAFAQTSAPATAPTGITAPAPAGTASSTVAPGKSAAAVPEVKAPEQAKKKDMHSQNTHHEKTAVPAKTAETPKS
jgi:hypothetical protein